MREFTKGPWRQGNVVELLLNRKCREIISDEGKIGLAYGVTDQENIANANLMAAAPELYEALERIKLTGVFVGAIAQEMMEAALKKARGE